MCYLTSGLDKDWSGMTDIWKILGPQLFEKGFQAISKINLGIFAKPVKVFLLP